MFRILVILAALSGCVAQQSPVQQVEDEQSELKESVYLAATPFFPQQEYQCGPAALATLLVETGVDVQPEALISKVYLPERRGSLQVEMLAAGRQYQRVPYQNDPTVDALFDELYAGRRCW